MAEPVHARLLSVAADIARRQFGVVAWDQMWSAGIDGETVARWVAAGVLRRVHPEIYAFGPQDLSLFGQWMAAQLWGEMLSHQTAGMVIGLLDVAPHKPHVTVGATRSGRCAALRVHRSPVPADQVVRVGPWTVTSWSRTILDVADTAPPWRLRAMLDKAIDLKIYDHGEMLALIERSRGRRGLKRLRPVVAQLQDTTEVLRSNTERRVRTAIRELGLPEPLVNHRIPRLGQPDIELDLYWPRLLLCVELDGPQHELPFQRARDEARDRWLWEQRRIRTLRYPLRGTTVDEIVADLAPHLT